MLSVWEAIVLGIVQGLTEFLPVSSSGHLEIVKALFGDTALGNEGLLMTVVLHFGTALGTILVFRKDILEIIKGLFTGDKDQVAFAVKIIISMIPAVFVGLYFEDLIDSFFTGKLVFVCGMLVVTGLLLFLADRAKDSDKKVSYWSAAIIGIAQAIAILPGISRSGATISTSVLLGIDKGKAARFSFLMVVPLIFGKVAKDILDGEMESVSDNILPTICGFIASLLVGIFACTLMINLVRKSRLDFFAYYCFAIGILGMGYFYFIK